MRGDEALIAGYLLGELSPAERSGVEARMAGDPLFADAVERMRPVVAQLEEMPALGWAGGDAAPQPPLPALPGLSRPRRLRLVPRVPVAVAAAVLALAAGVAIGALVAGRGGERPAGPELVLTRQADAGESARGAARVGAGGETLRVTVTGLRPSPAGAFYELWLMDDADHLVSLGSFRVPESGAAEVDVPLPAPVRDFSYIDVSLEPGDGDPAHSGTSVLRGPTGTT